MPRWSHLLCQAWGAVQAAGRATALTEQGKGRRPRAARVSFQRVFLTNYRGALPTRHLRKQRWPLDRGGLGVQQTPRVCVSVPMAVPETTAEMLKHKINPSAGENCPHAVDVLLYTPGTCLLARHRLGGSGPWGFLPWEGKPRTTDP